MISYEQVCDRRPLERESAAIHLPNTGGARGGLVSCAIPANQPMGSIGQSIAQLRDEIVAGLKMVDSLEQQFAPVLRPHSSGQTPSEPGARPAVCALDAQLSDCSHGMQILLERLSALSLRCAL